MTQSEMARLEAENEALREELDAVKAQNVRLTAWLRFLRDEVTNRRQHFIAGVSGMKAAKNEHASPHYWLGVAESAMTAIGSKIERLSA